jgi:hypothetical protein
MIPPMPIPIVSTGDSANFNSRCCSVSGDLNDLRVKSFLKTLLIQDMGCLSAQFFNLGLGCSIVDILVDTNNVLKNRL